MKLTEAQIAELRFFVTAGKARAEHAILQSKTAEERTFYQDIIDRAHLLLPILTGEETVEIENEEET